MPTLHYELLGLVGAEHSPEAAQAILTQVRDEIAKAGGEVLTTNVIGKRKLAYEVKKERFGTYFELDFNLDGNAMLALDRELKLRNDVIRFLIIKSKLKTAKELEEEVRIQGKIQARKSREEAAVRQVHETEQRTAEATSPKRKDETPLTLEDIDKKIDEILDEDIAK
ncbi:MAG: 30S ribosomal protein S6 [bacterium]|nr:30S ribosomal protein S6 [bacterium]